MSDQISSVTELMTQIGQLPLTQQPKVILGGHALFLTPNLQLPMHYEVFPSRLDDLMVYILNTLDKTVENEDMPPQVPPAQCAVS